MRSPLTVNLGRSMLNLVRPDIDALADSPILYVWRAGQGVEGIIGLWAGEPDSATPAFICDAAIAALRAGHTHYTYNRGIPELRAAIGRYVRRLYRVEVAEGRIAATSAGINAVELVCQALLGAGSRAVAITPSWPNIMRAMSINGAEVTEVPLRRANAGWSLDMDAVEAACGPGVKMLYLASPANPTGWQITPEEARHLLALSRKRGFAIVSDEVYHRIVYDRPVAFSFLEIAEPDDNVFVINSFSKAWAMSGWRLGWLIYPGYFLPTAEKLIQFNTSGGQAFLQHGAVAALDEGEAFVEDFVGRCRAGREIVSRRLAAMPRVREIESEGAFYSMFEVEGVADTLGFCMDLVREARLGLAPGIAFGAGAQTLIRLCYAKSGALLEEAMDRLEGRLARL
jgi:aspartate/methionine/tyrosine aminotransferase